MFFPEAEHVADALGKIKGKELIFEDQLSFDLGACSKIETGVISAPSHEEGIRSDFPYALKSIIGLLKQDANRHREMIFRLNSSRKQSISQELENIISELNNFKPTKPISPAQFENIIYALSDSLDGKGISVFFSRVAYFTTAELLLIHYLRSAHVIPESERNPYKEPGLTIHQLLSRSCPNLIKEKHNWLFAKQNNYSWYHMSADTFHEIDQILSHWEFREESISLFSLLYERYLDENGLRKYAHYTPPLIVRFIWDLISEHSKDTSFFRWMGQRRVPKLIFDPTMGSGNFLIEAARRMQIEIEEEKDPKKAFAELSEALGSGLFGCDIDVFAYYFSEMKLLWKLAWLMEKGETLNIPPHQKITLSLSVIHQNALRLYNHEQLDMIEAKEDPPLSLDIKFGIPSLEGHLKSISAKIKHTEKFDICVGCPPEQILKEQKDFMRELIQKVPYWRKHYEADLIYSSWFFILGLSKLREGGRLFYLTESYWPMENGASKLRKYILDHSKVLCLIDLGHIKIDEDTTPLPRYMTLLEKCSGKEERDNHKIKMIKVHPSDQKDEAASAAFILGKILAKAKTVDRPGKIYTDDEVDIYFSGIPQGELDENPWQQIYDSGFSQILKQILTFKTTLQYFCAIEENKEPEKEHLTLMTPELSAKNKFTLYEKRAEPGNFLTLTPKPIAKESLFYLMSLLNSPVINFWYANNGNRKSGRRLFDSSSLKMIPIRPVNFTQPIEESLKRDKLEQIKTALSKFDEKYLMAYLNLELTHGREEIVHDGIVLLQHEMIESERSLRHFDKFFKEPVSVPQIPPQIPEFHPEPEPLAFRKIYPMEQQCPLKDHPKIFIQKESSNIDLFCLTQFKYEAGIKNEGEHLTLISTDNSIIRIYAQKELLGFIESDLKTQIHNFWNEIEASIYMPKEETAFGAFKEEIISHCSRIKEKQLKILKILNDLIYKLYGFNIDDPDPVKARQAASQIQIIETA